MVEERADEDVNLIFGTIIDDTLGDEIRITIIATGFDAEANAAQAASAQRAPEQRKPGSLFDNRDRESGNSATPAPAQPAADDYAPRHSYEPRAGQGGVEDRRADERRVDDRRYDDRRVEERRPEERRTESTGLFTNSDRFREERREDYRLSRPSQRRDDDGDDDLDVPSFMR